MPRTSYKSCLFASLLLQWKEQQLIPWGHLTPAEEEDIMVTLEVQIIYLFIFTNISEEFSKCVCV